MPTIRAGVFYSPFTVRITARDLHAGWRLAGVLPMERSQACRLECESLCDAGTGEGEGGKSQNSRPVESDAILGSNGSVEVRQRQPPGQATPNSPPP